MNHPAQSPTEFFDVLDRNGLYTGAIASREDCHAQGLWHKAVVVFILSPDNKNVLLQKRSSTKKLWPGLWDVTAGGHVLSGELNYQAAPRETAEELGIELAKTDLEFIGSAISENIIGDVTNRHFNEYYVTHLDLDPQTLKLQPEEVADIRWFSVEELRERINNNYDGIADKVGCWEYLFWYLGTSSKTQNNSKAQNDSSRA